MDGLPKLIKTLRAVSKTIQVKQEDGNINSSLLDFFIVGRIKVLQTSSIESFIIEMTDFHNNIDLEYLIKNDASFNTPKILQNIFSFASHVHTKPFNSDLWQDLLIYSKSKFTFNYWQLGQNYHLDQKKEIKQIQEYIGNLGTTVAGMRENDSLLTTLPI